MRRNTFTMEALRVATSHFCKARGIFCDSCFERKRIGEDGETVSVLKKPPSGDYGAEKLYNLLEFGVAECLDRQCLRSVSLCIVRSHDSALMEELTLECEVIGGSEYSQTSLFDAIRELTRKHRLLIQTLSPLPEETAFKVRLTLIEAKMPYRAWTPPFFLSHCETHSPHPQQFDGKPVTLRVGKFSSDTETCEVSIQSLYDSLENLSSQDKSQLASSQIVFDPAFTQVPRSVAVAAVEGADVDLYQTIKTFVVADKSPSMKRTHEAHCHVTMPTIRTYFHQLVDEGVLVRRGQRFYPAKSPATPNEEPTLRPQRQSTTATAETKSGKWMKRGSQNAAPVIAQLVQTYKAAHSIHNANCIPITSAPSIPHSRRTRAVLGASAERDHGGDVSTQRYGRIVTAPIIQRIRPPHLVEDVCSTKFGRPVFVASSSIVQVAQKPACRRQKIAKVL